MPFDIQFWCSALASAILVFLAFCGVVFLLRVLPPRKRRISVTIDGQTRGAKVVNSTTLKLARPIECKGPEGAQWTATPEASFWQSKHGRTCECGGCKPGGNR